MKDLYRLTMGVKGARTLNVRYFDTLEEAETRAERHRSSNSTGEYVAFIDKISEIGEIEIKALVDFTQERSMRW